jgi:hypothetical protein
MISIFDLIVHIIFIFVIFKIYYYIYALYIKHNKSLFYYNQLKTLIYIIFLLSIKIITQYSKCSISYIEYKLFHKKKEDSILYRILQSMINIRNSCIYPYYILSILFAIIFFILKFYIKNLFNIK